MNIEIAQALPSYARQTGQECTSCHVGGFGPQLTPYGARFKIGGYTDSDGQAGHLPFSAMMLSSFTHTSKDQSEDAGPYSGANQNLLMDEFSGFLAGGLTKNIGAFVQTTYSGADHIFALDNLDLRAAGTVQLGGKDTIIGMTVNNNPGLTSPLNTQPAWRFPYASSSLAPTPGASVLLDGGLEHQVYGLSAYTFWNNSLYAEVGGYGSLAHSTLHNLGISDDVGELSGVAPYWNLGYGQDFHTWSYTVGLIGLAAKLHPDRQAGPTNDYTDLGVEASYQFLGTRLHSFALNTAYLHEHQSLDATFNSGESLNHKLDLNNFNLAASYYYQQTYGFTLGFFNTWGDRDEILYADHRTGKPDSNGLILQADWTPFGKESSWMAPWANLRLGLQYTLYNKFDGASSNYDNSGRDASDNNTLFAFVWLSL